FYHTLSIMSILAILFFSRAHLPPHSQLFPYTTLFRSRASSGPRRSISRAPRLPFPSFFSQRSCGLSPLGYGIVPFGTPGAAASTDRKSTRLNSSHQIISYAVFCLKKNNQMFSPFHFTT